MGLLQQIPLRRKGQLGFDKLQQWWAGTLVTANGSGIGLLVTQESLTKSDYPSSGWDVSQKLGCCRLPTKEGLGRPSR